MTTHVHPDWCGHNHVCSIDGPGAEHRSYPLTVDTTGARLVITRVQTRSGHDRVELRVVADLPNDPTRARHATRRIVAAVTNAIAAAQLPAGRQ